MNDDKTKEPDMENVLEILLRLVRSAGEGTGGLHHHQYATQTSGALYQAAAPGSSIFAAQHTTASLAVLALFRVLQDLGFRQGGEDGKRDANERTKGVIRALPQNLLFKSLDGMFREWFADRKGHR